MRKLTDVILSTSVYDGVTENITGEPPNVDLFNEQLTVICGTYLVRVDQHAASQNAMHCDLFIAVIEEHHFQAVLDEFYKIIWEVPESVQLMLKRENDEVFSIYVPKP